MYKIIQNIAPLFTAVCTCMHLKVSYSSAYVLIIAIPSNLTLIYFIYSNLVRLLLSANGALTFMSNIKLT